MHWQRLPIVRQVRARPRLFIATLTAIAIGVFLPQGVASHAADALADCLERRRRPLCAAGLRP
jgi:hypothetical protein